MVPQNTFTSQLDETEEIIEDYETLEQTQDHENVTNDQENTRTSTFSSLLSGAKSVASDVSSYWAGKLYDTILPFRNTPYENIIRNANSYEEWAEAANKLDQLKGRDEWKNDIKSPDYDHELLYKRWSQLKNARNTGDLQQMMFLLRTSLARNLGDMGQPRLYEYSHIGTKRLIETYINEVVKQMNIICDTESKEISTKDKLEFFNNTRQSFGRTALLLSGGATFGLIHLGVIKCLHEQKLLPRIISGASSGSIVAAILCTKMDEEISSALKTVDTDISLDFFERPEDPDTVFIRLQRLFEQGALFDVEILRECMRHNISEITFQEAYNRTRRVLNITVSSSAMFDMPQLLNYLTAPNVLIWSAVAASCSVPLVYNSSPLMAKDKSGNGIPWIPSEHRWIDGSVVNDLPMQQLSELFNVNHFIVCQVNPHVVPFVQGHLIPSPISRLAKWFLTLSISEVRHRMNQLIEIGVAQNLINKVQSVMSQTYIGDITIVPNISYSDFLNLLANPSPESIRRAKLRGERATWPKISIIKNHCQIELTLDEIVFRLRRRQIEEEFASRINESSGQSNSNVKRNRTRIQPILAAPTQE